MRKLSLVLVDDHPIVLTGLEVLRLFIQGKTIVEIARLLNRSDKTISLQKNGAMRKLGVDNNQVLISYCITHNLFG